MRCGTRGVVDELSTCFEISPVVLRGKVTDETYVRIDALFAVWERAVDRGAEVFVRYRRLREQGYAPARTTKRLARANARVDDAERELFNALELPWPEHLHGRRDPLEPRSLSYFVACLSDEMEHLTQVS